MSIKLFDSELKVMNVLWQHGDMTAKSISDILAAEIGWNMNTTYTVIKKCIAKGAISRSEPNFMCKAEVSRQEIQQSELSDFVDRIFDGAADKLFAALLNSKKISDEELQNLKNMVEKLK